MTPFAPLFGALCFAGLFAPADGVCWQEPCLPGDGEVAPPMPPLPRLRPKGLLTMRSLRVTDSDQGGARVYMGSSTEYSMGTDAQGNFVIAQGGRADSPPVLFMEKNTGRVTLRSRTTEVRALDLGGAGRISVGGVMQWRTLYAEDFDTPAGPVGWSRNQMTKCAGITMLGGFCRFSKGDVKKTFANLPPHDHLRIRATFHFIDSWVGEAGYMKLNVGEAFQPIVVWSEQHQETSSKGVSVCGGTAHEGKFAVPIDITIPHTQAAVEITFGSTMADADPCDESWGVSAVEVMVRT